MWEWSVGLGWVGLFVLAGLGDGWCQVDRCTLALQAAVALRHAIPVLFHVKEEWH